jgi:hypothetical protein
LSESDPVSAREVGIPLNLSALEPLYAPHEEPNRHRVRAERTGDPALVVKGRRKSDIAIVQSLRSMVRTWRESEYAGASETTRELLYHWMPVRVNGCRSATTSASAKR